MPSILIDILPSILNHVDKADLLTICFVNKDYCSFSQDALYRDIRIYKLSEASRICQTLAQFTHLARRVRSFHISSDLDSELLCSIPELSTSLRSMIFLRNLGLYTFTNDFSFLGGCTFKLASFTCNYFDLEPLQQFLLSQPSLTNVGLGLFMDIDDPFEIGATFLPNVTRVTTQFSWLAQIIPNRPVNEVDCIGSVNDADSVDLSFFTRSTAPIQKISIDYTYLYPKSGQLLASIFPSLTHLYIDVVQPNWFIEDTRHADFTEWVKNLLAALVSLRVFKSEFHFDGENMTFSVGYLPHIKEISDRAPKLEYVGVFDYDKLYCGKRVGGEWVLCDEADFNEA